LVRLTREHCDKSRLRLTLLLHTVNTISTRQLRTGYRARNTLECSTVDKFVIVFAVPSC